MSLKPQHTASAQSGVQFTFQTLSPTKLVIIHIMQGSHSHGKVMEFLEF